MLAHRTMSIALSLGPGASLMVHSDCPLMQY